MYTLISATIKLDLNEFNFDFDSGYIDGSDQWLTPNEESYIGACTTIQDAFNIVDCSTVSVYLDLSRANLIIKFIYIHNAVSNVYIRHFDFTNFEGKMYEIDNDLYCPELAQILKDRIHEIKKEQE